MNVHVEHLTPTEARELFRRRCEEIGHTPESFLGGVADGSIDLDDPELHGRYMSVYMCRPFWDQSQ